MDIIKGRIKKVEYIENTEYVYDISVEDNHNFLANGVIVSNCHHIPAATMRDTAIKAENAYYRIGVSATPWRDAGDDLYIEAIVSKRNPEHAITASYLIERGYLVPATIYNVPIKQTFKGRNYHKIVNQAIVDNEYRNNIIVKIAKKMLDVRNATTLILVQRVEHGDKLKEKLHKVIPEEKFTVYIEDPKKGVEVPIRVSNVEFLSGRDDSLRRAAVIKATKEKKVKVLIGSTIADEGLDIPSLDTLILAGGGKSSTRAFQRIGRVLRLFDGKDKGIVFDFEDYTPMLRRHAQVRRKLYKTETAWTLKQFNMDLLK